MPLVLNPRSGFVSPQFHCVFDDQFDSVASDANFNDLWAHKAGLQYQRQEEDSYLQTEIPEQFIVPFKSDAPMIPTDQPLESNEMQEMFAHDNDTFEPDLPEPELSDPVENPNAPGQEQPIIMQQNEGDPQLGPTTQSGCQVKRTQQLQESSILPKLRSFVSKVLHHAIMVAHSEDGGFSKMIKFISYAASIADNDTMYLHEALQQED